MQKFSLEALGHQLLERSGAAGGGHTADTVVGGHERILRQTVIAMVKGAVLAEHENPGEATVYVLRGRVRLSAGDLSWEGRSGDLLVVPDARHCLDRPAVSPGRAASTLTPSDARKPQAWRCCVRGRERRRP
jgi:quercetin dioxygenase-like cupin family protein